MLRGIINIPEILQITEPFLHILDVNNTIHHSSGVSSRIKRTLLLLGKNQMIQKMAVMISTGTIHFSNETLC